MVILVSVPYVNSAAIMTAVTWESRFQHLPPAAGVIFISIRPVPVEQGECTIFEVRLGLVSTLGESTGVSLIKHVLAEEIASGRYEIKVAVYRGVRCAGEPSSGPDHTHSYSS